MKTHLVYLLQRSLHRSNGSFLHLCDKFLHRRDCSSSAGTTPWEWRLNPPSAQWLPVGATVGSTGATASSAGVMALNNAEVTALSSAGATASSIGITALNTADDGSFLHWCNNFLRNCADSLHCRDGCFLVLLNFQSINIDDDRRQPCSDLMGLTEIGRETPKEYVSKPSSRRSGN